MVEPLSTSTPDQTPGIGLRRIDVYRALLSSVEGRQARGIVAGLLRESIAAATEEDIPAINKPDWLAIADKLEVSAAEDWRSSP